MSKSASRKSPTGSDKVSDETKTSPVVQSSLRKSANRRKYEKDPLLNARIKLAAALAKRNPSLPMSSMSINSLSPPPFVFSAKSSSSKDKQTIRKKTGALTRKRQQKARERRKTRKNKFKKRTSANSARRRRRQKAR